MYWGRGHRWMFWLTGMPGWMRAGMLPPCLQYLREGQQLELLKREQEVLRKYLEEIEKKIKELSEKKEE